MSHRTLFRWLSNLCCFGAVASIWFGDPADAAVWFSMGALNAVWGLYE